MEITIKGKGGKIRIVPINESIRIELEKLMTVTPRGHKLLVPGGVKTHNAIKRLEQFIAEHRASVRDTVSARSLTFHGLRHTYAKEQYLLFIKSGCTEAQAGREVSKLLGHEREDVTRIYPAGQKDGDEDV
jgi:integrase